MKALSIIIVALTLCTGCTEFNPTSSPPKESYTDECTFRIEQIHFISKGDTILGSILFPKEIEAPRGKPRGIFDPFIIPIVLANPAASSGECASGIQPCPAVVLIPGSGKSMRLNNYAKEINSFA